MNWAHKIILDKHGWKKSQFDAGWYREHKILDRYTRKTEFVGGDTSPYLPRYDKEVTKLLKKGFNKFIAEEKAKNNLTYINHIDKVRRY
jgi:hypothetical protein